MNVPQGRSTSLLSASQRLISVACPVVRHVLSACACFASSPRIIDFANPDFPYRIDSKGRQVLSWPGVAKHGKGGVETALKDWAMSNRTLTEIYVGSLLVISIVILMTVKWFSIPRLVDYITFGSSIASIVLALMAIAYAVLSGSAMDRGMASLSTSVEQIKSATNNIADLYNRLREDVKGSSTTVEASLKNVQAAVERTDRLNSDSSPKIKNPLERVEIFDPPKTASLKDKCALIPFAARGSFIGIALMYTCVFVYRKENFFLLSDLERILGAETFYMHGYLVAAEAAGVVDLLMPNSETSIGVKAIEGYDDEIIGTLEAAFQAYIADIEKDDSRRATNTRMFENLKKYLNAGVVEPLWPETQARTQV